MGHMNAKRLARKFISVAEEPLHYKKLTRLILESGESQLTMKGGVTPGQTVGAILRKNPHIFRKCGSGYYDLA